MVRCPALNLSLWNKCNSALTVFVVFSPSPYGEDEWDDDTGSNRSGVRVKAIYNYEGQEGDELSFKAGRSSKSPVTGKFAIARLVVVMNCQLNKLLLTI